MELYTLDGLLRRSELIQGYESYVWTERYSDLGDLQVVTPSTPQFRNLMASGTFIGHSESRRVMRIVTIEDNEADDGSKKLTIHCKEMSSVLKDRIALSGFVGSKPGTWSASGKPSDILRLLFDYSCRDGHSDPTDVLPLITAGSLYPSGNLPEDEDSYSIERPTSLLYEAIKEIADVWDLGFRLYKGDDTGAIYFDVYKGNDRTTGQTVLEPVIFSEELNSLQNVSEITSVAQSKNVAYVRNDFGMLIVYSDGASETTSGFAKRTLYVDATDIGYPERDPAVTDAQQEVINKASRLVEALDEDKTAFRNLVGNVRLLPGQATLMNFFVTSMVTAGELVAGDETLISDAITASTALEADEDAAMQIALLQRGKEELAKNRSISAFDGEITQLSPYKYRLQYEMGDLVEMRTSAGVANQMLVTEQIFSADETGERAYPTLTIKLFITPGSWLAWENTQVWQDAPGVWATS